jgi:NAD(P)-dependent dehydrogenase (short-subunit alcohol dehydrogenase family)
MANRIAVVTGANAGLGYQIALKLAREGMGVVMACRSLERAESARARLVAEVPDATAVMIRLDVSEPDSIGEFTRQFTDRVGQLDLLINNAGITGAPLARNSAGHELHLATNYLGVFALTGKLLPLFAGDRPGRIVNVGSLAHRFVKLDFDDIDWERSRYGEWRAYGRSKLALLTFTMELNRRLRQAGSNVIALAAHPGFAATEIGKSNPLTNPSNALGKWFNSKVEQRIPSAEEAARPILFAACDEGAEGGDYYGPGGWLEIAGAPARARLNPAARDVDAGRRLWALTESITGASYLSDSRDAPRSGGERVTGSAGSGQ